MTDRKRLDNRGAISVFSALMVFFIFDIFVVSVLYAQYAGTKGMACDTVSLADNAVRATYNRTIKDAYGITCYTETEEAMTNIAEYFMNDAMSVNAAMSGKVVYEDKSLANVDEFKSQVIDYMKRWDRVAGQVTAQDIMDYCQMTLNIPHMRKWLETDLNSSGGKSFGLGTVGAATSTDPASIAKQQEKLQKLEEADKARTNALGNIDFVNESMWMTDTKKFSYSGASNTLAPVNVVIGAAKFPDENIRMAIDVLNRVEEFMSDLNAVYTSRGSRDEKYELALYAVNNFSALRYYGATALTGNYYGSGDFTSISPWAENEFLINAADNDDANVRAFDSMVYDIMFTEYLYKLYYSYISEPQICEYAEVLGEGDEDEARLYRDEFVVGLSAQLAMKALNKMYKSEPTPDLTMYTYQKFIELFDMLEVHRDERGFIKRLQYLMDANAAQSPGAEAQEFSCANAHTDPQLRDCYVETDGLMVGNGIGFYVRK